MGDREAEPVSEEHCANVVLALLVAEAYTCAEPVERFGKLEFFDQIVSSTTKDETLTVGSPASVTGAGKSAVDPDYEISYLHELITRLIGQRRHGIGRVGRGLELVGFTLSATTQGGKQLADSSCQCGAR